MVRIICVGNRFYAPDASGCLVFEQLQQLQIPPYLELIEGGLGGLDLLPWFEGCRGVVLVDRVDGFGCRGELLLLKREDICTDRPVVYDHSGGLQYLLHCLPALGLDPELYIVGIEGEVDGTVLRKAAELALETARAI